jgi:hypothetical protein
MQNSKNEREVSDKKAQEAQKEILLISFFRYLVSLGGLVSVSA